MASDYAFGLASQVAILPRLRAFFGDDLTPTVGQFNHYDYESPSAVYELKTRRITHDSYPTTLIGANKVNPAHPKRQVYIFNFIDGTYYIRYDKAIFDTFELAPFARNDPGFVARPYIFIPITALAPIP
jgi:hypothetical protein